MRRKRYDIYKNTLQALWKKCLLLDSIPRLIMEWGGSLCNSSSLTTITLKKLKRLGIGLWRRWERNCEQRLAANSIHITSLWTDRRYIRSSRQSLWQGEKNQFILKPGRWKPLEFGGCQWCCMWDVILIKIQRVEWDKINRMITENCRSALQENRSVFRLC